MNHRVTTILKVLFAVGAILTSTVDCWCIGRNCEAVISECTGVTCHNGGSCVDIDINDYDYGAYRCDCECGFTGTHCETAIISLTITADRSLLEVYVDGDRVPQSHLPNYNGWAHPDVIYIPTSSRLVAVYAAGAGTTSGIKASTSDDRLITNSLWKCTNVTYPDWFLPNYDDSLWPDAVVLFYSQGQTVSGRISPSARFIWTNATYIERTYEYGPGSPYTYYVPVTDDYVYCRGTISDVNNCECVYCLNGGSCVDGDDSYTCNCLPGYTGTHCETDIDNCADVSCLNGGTCVDAVNSYTCNCLNAYTGVHCETDIANCSAFKCSNGGTCALKTTVKKTCVCPPDFTGPRCNQPVK